MIRFRLEIIAAVTAAMAWQAGAQIPPPATQPQAVAELSWPRVHTDGDTTVNLYPPQLDSRENDQLKARTAIQVTTKSNGKQSYGVIWMTARAEVDNENRLVALNNLRLDELKMPGNPAGESAVLALPRTAIWIRATSTPTPTGSATTPAPIPASPATTAAFNTIPTATGTASINSNSSSSARIWNGSDNPARWGSSGLKDSSTRPPAAGSTGNGWRRRAASLIVRQV